MQHIAMKGRMRPIANLSDESMLDWIKMDVVHVPLEIPIVADCVFPKPPLPESMLSILATRDRSAGFCHGLCEAAFDQHPPDWIARVTRRQRHDGVEVVGQNHDR